MYAGLSGNELAVLQQAELSGGEPAILKPQKLAQVNQAVCLGEQDRVLVN